MGTWQLELFHAHHDCLDGSDRLGSGSSEFSHLPKVTWLLSGRVLNPGVTFKPVFLIIILCHSPPQMTQTS